MKRLLSGVAVATLAMGGLMAVSTAPADAAPYPGTIKTTCHITVVNSKASSVKLVIRVSAPGNGEPRGKATIILDRDGRGDRETKERPYDGGRDVIDFGKQKTGNYTATFDFNSRPRDSVYKDCADSISFKVTKKG